MPTRLTLLCLFLGLNCSAYASPASDEAIAYGTLKIQAMICKEKYTGDRLKVELGEETPTQAYKNFLQCQSTVSSDSKAVYKKVLSKAKGADAKKAVKDYHVAFMSFLNGLDPKSGETKYAYSQRVSALESSLESAKQRMDLEIE